LLVSKGNVMIGYNPIYEYTALPDARRVVAAVQRALATGAESPARQARADRAESPAAEQVERAIDGLAQPDERDKRGGPREVTVKMPVMGEGIRAARIVALLKKPGDAVALDEALCEVETDKAVYPIESSVAGTFQAWRCAV